jgi:hypothetical protein
MRIMPVKKMEKSLATILMFAVCLSISGCPDEPVITKGPTVGERTIVVPTHHMGTVLQYARLVGSRMLPVRGYGVVGGLGKDGSSQVPSYLRNYLIQYLRRKNIGSRKAGLEKLSPERILRDMDTAIVEISGFIPSCAPKGKIFDVKIRAIGSQVRSLEGGVLYEAELKLATDGVNVPSRGSKIIATAAGPVFVNPFIDEKNVAELVRLRDGRVIGGGKVKAARPIRLQLMTPDFSRAMVIQRSINERFQRPGEPRVANGKGSDGVAITIPPQWRHEYIHFLELVTHLSLQNGVGQWERHARGIAKAMKLPKANHEELSLVWEAMGRRAIPVISTSYTDADPFISYYSARAGMRLGDMVAAPEVILRAAASPGSPLRNEAVKELGRYPRFVQALSILRKTLDDKDGMLRIIAYESLLKIGRNSAVMTIPVGNFYLDIVDSKRQDIIYATQSGTSRIALFGTNMEVMRPIYFSALQDLLTINAATADKYITMFRKVGTGSRISPAFKIEPKVKSLIRAIGQKAKNGQGMLMLPDLDSEGKPKRDKDGQIVYKKASIKGLGLNYGQLVTILYRLSKQSALVSSETSKPAKFVLQKPAGLQEFLRSTVDSGRPNITEH